MGFEPMIPFSRYAHLANECLQPLGHVSLAADMPRFAVKRKAVRQACSEGVVCASGWGRVSSAVADLCFKAIGDACRTAQSGRLASSGAALQPAARLKSKNRDICPMTGLEASTVAICG